MESNLPTDSGVAAIVNGDEMVTLWKGITPIQVASSDVEEMRTLGFTTSSPQQIPELASTAKKYAELIPSLVDGFIQALDDGVIDTHEEATLASLQRGMRLLGDTIAEMLAIAHVTFPVKQGPVVTMKRTVEGSDGEQRPEVTEIDPGQLGDFLAQGWLPVNQEGKK